MHVLIIPGTTAAMVVLLLLLLCPIIAAESFVYLHPVNPKLHPRDMYPIQKSLRGINKVRDLPASGIVYINRIKPMSDEFRGAAARADNTFVKENAPAPLRELAVEPQKSAETDYTAYDDSHPKENAATTAMASNNRGVAQVMDSEAVLSTTSATTLTRELVTEFPTMPPMLRTTTKEMEFSSSKPEKNVLKIAISKKTKNVEPPKEYDLSREAQVDLERLISQIKEQEKVDLINEHPGVQTIDMPRAAMFTERTRHGSPSAKLVSLSRTARIHTGQITRKPSKAKLVQLRKKKSFGRVGISKRRGPDFDPWERMGQ
ncbi:hypothetical protein Y032_0495g2472 [Ancylostoma ceylanicum]|nr:hypothetical protein Y032_0495g2472 [Ancylostoma ceylanicum]